MALLFFGEKEFGGEKIGFRLPGPTSHARWMAKAIYTLKIFLFRQQFTLSNKQKSALREMCIFLIKLYIKPWFECTNAIKAPLQDLNFIKDSIKYADTDSAISKVILKKMSNHLWYLAEDCVALAFFDANVSSDEKRKMVKNLSSKEPVVKLKHGRTYSKMLDFQNYNIYDFVSQKTMTFFEKFGLSTDFLKQDPSTWDTSFAFDEGWTFCRDLSPKEV